MVDENGKLSAPGRPDARGTKKPLSAAVSYAPGPMAVEVAARGLSKRGRRDLKALAT